MGLQLGTQMANIEKLFNAEPIGPASRHTVRLATAAALPACTAAGTGVGHTLTANAVGVLTVDGVASVLNDRILVQDQASADDNGIYLHTTEGTAGVAFILTRATDFDQATAGEIVDGAGVNVTAGATNAGLTFILDQGSAITVDTTNLPFIAGNGAGDVTSRDAREKSGSDVTILEHDRIGIVISITETVAPLVGVVLLQVANGTMPEMLGDVLDWEPCPGLIVGTTAVTDGEVDISGSDQVTVALTEALPFSWFRLSWVGTTGEGTMTAHYTGKRSR